MKSTCYLIFFLFANLANQLIGYAQGQVIKVTDSKSQEPVPFATIHFIKQNVAYSTNENGFFIVSAKLLDQKD